MAPSASMLQDHQEKHRQSHRGWVFLNISVLFKTTWTLIWPVITTVTISIAHGEPPFITVRKTNCYFCYVIWCKLIFLHKLGQKWLLHVYYIGQAFSAFRALHRHQSLLTEYTEQQKQINLCYHYCLFLHTRSEFLPSLHWKTKTQTEFTEARNPPEGTKGWASISGTAQPLSFTAVGEEVKVFCH